MAALALVVPASRSAGQDQPAAFVHGFFSDGSTWQSAATQLARDFQIQAYTPDLPWAQPYATQAGVLATYVSGIGQNIITAGHSNGAIVSRFLNRDHAAPNNRIVSVGTPHLGTGLAHSVLDGNLAFWGSRIAFRIASPLDYYSYWEVQAGVQSPWDHVWHAFDQVGGLFQNLGHAFAALGYVSPGLGSQIPVLQDMMIGSAALNAINSPSNLIRESSAMSARVGIQVTVGSPRDLVFRVVDPVVPGSANDYAFWKDVAAFAALGAFWHYEEYPLDAPFAFPLRSQRFQWPDLAAELDWVDVNYLSLIGALASYASSDAYSWYDNDGVVRTASQEYPGGTRQVLIQDGPLHMEQKQHAAVLEQLRLVFRNDFGVPPRTLLPAPILTASVEQVGLSKRPRLSWNPVPSATSYRIYRRLKQGGVESPWQLWREVTTTTSLDETMVTRYLGGNAAGASEYVGYHVRAVNSGHESVQS
ncbi:MAG TPA: hypothetical protein VGE02_16565 [Gemmatimonadales bacterium]